MKDVFIANPEELQKKVQKIKADGVSHLHVVSDFDRTLTPAFLAGEKPSTSFAQIRRGGYLSEEYIEQAETLFDHYYPIETSPTISVEQKKPEMRDWWKKHLNLMVRYGLKKEHVLDIIQKRKVELRKGAVQLIELLAKHNIQFLIFSAGIGDLIQENLRTHGLLHKNMHIISNFFKYDSNGNTIGYGDDVIHIFNKDEGQIKNSTYYDQIKDKKNLILLGDTLGDVDMASGLKHEVTIKIAFLNRDTENQKEIFSKEFDVLILNDGPMDYVNDLLKQIL